MARIISRKLGSNKRSAVHLDRGDYNGPAGIVFSGSRGALILNLTNGERNFSVLLSDEETETLAARFKARDAVVKAEVA